LPGWRYGSSFSVSCVEFAEEVRFFPSHSIFIFTATLMVIAGKMEQAVNEEAVYLSAYRMLSQRSLAYRSGHRDNDISQEFGAEVGKITFPEREREHVRDRIVPPVFPVEGADGSVAGEKNAQFSVMKSEALEQHLEFSLYSLRCQPSLPLTVFYQDNQRVSSPRQTPCPGNRSCGGRFR